MRLCEWQVPPPPTWACHRKRLPLQYIITGYRFRPCISPHLQRCVCGRVDALKRLQIHARPRGCVTAGPTTATRGTSLELVAPLHTRWGHETYLATPQAPPPPPWACRCKSPWRWLWTCCCIDSSSPPPPPGCSCCWGGGTYWWASWASTCPPAPRTCPRLRWPSLSMRKPRGCDSCARLLGGGGCWWWIGAEYCAMSRWDRGTGVGMLAAR